MPWKLCLGLFWSVCQSEENRSSCFTQIGAEKQVQSSRVAACKTCVMTAATVAVVLIVILETFGNYSTVGNNISTSGNKCSRWQSCWNTNKKSFNHLYMNSDRTNKVVAVSSELVWSKEKRSLDAQVILIMGAPTGSQGQRSGLPNKLQPLTDREGHWEGTENAAVSINVGRVISPSLFSGMSSFWSTKILFGDYRNDHNAHWEMKSTLQDSKPQFRTHLICGSPAALFSNPQNQEIKWREFQTPQESLLWLNKLYHWN